MVFNFRMVKKAYKRLRIISVCTRRTSRIDEYMLTNDEWKLSRGLCLCRKAATMNTEKQPSSTYITMTTDSNLFRTLKDKRRFAFKKCLETISSKVAFKTLRLQKSNELWYV